MSSTATLSRPSNTPTGDAPPLTFEQQIEACYEQRIRELNSLLAQAQSELAMFRGDDTTPVVNAKQVEPNILAKAIPLEAIGPVIFRTIKAWMHRPCTRRLVAAGSPNCETDLAYDRWRERQERAAFIAKRDITRQGKAPRRRGPRRISDRQARKLHFAKADQSPKT